MTNANLYVASCTNGNNALPKFEALVISAHWLADNTDTQTYIETNTGRLHKIKNLELDFSEDTSMQDKTYKDLLYDFAIKFRSGKVDGVEEYFK